MFKNIKIASGMLLVLYLFGLIQIGSNLIGFYFIKKNSDSISAMSVIADEQNALSSSGAYLQQAQSAINNIVLEYELLIKTLYRRHVKKWRLLINPLNYFGGYLG